MAQFAPRGLDGENIWAKAKLLGGEEGDKYAALVGPTHTKVFNAYLPHHSALHNVGGSCAVWMKSHKLLVGGQKLVSLSLLTEQLEREYPTHSPVHLFAGHPMERRFYAYTFNGDLLFYDSREREPHHFLSKQPYLLSSMLVSPDSDQLVASSFDGRLLTWSLRSGKLMHDLVVEANMPLLKCQEVGKGVYALLDGNGAFSHVDINNFISRSPHQNTARVTFEYDHLREMYISAVGRTVEITTAAEDCRVIDLETFGGIIDLGQTLKGDLVVACHQEFLSASFVESGVVSYWRPLEEQFMGRNSKSLSLIPFKSWVDV